MNLLDLLAILPFDWPGSPSRERSPAENLIAVLGLVVFPVLDFVVVLWGKLYEHGLRLLEAVQQGGRSQRSASTG